MKQDVRPEICSVMRYRNSTNLGDYLGVPLMNGKAKCNTFRRLIDKVNNRLAGWKTTIYVVFCRPGKFSESCNGSIPIFNMHVSML